MAKEGRIIARISVRLPLPFLEYKSLKIKISKKRNMLRVIFDTNIYGFLLKEPDMLQIQENIIVDKNFIV